MGYLSVYILYAMSVLGPDETMRLLEPYLSIERINVVDADVDIVTTDSLVQYLEYLEPIGIKSQ